MNLPAIKRFLVQVIVFSFPLAIVLGTYEYLMFDLGEAYTMSEVLELQEKKQGLFMRKYLSQNFNTYKIAGIKKYEPEVLVVGSSRVMQFKSDFFKGEFYNAGGLLQNHKDLNEFLLNKIDADFVIIGIDPWWFKEDNVVKARTWIDYGFEEGLVVNDRYTSLTELGKIIKDYLSYRNTSNIGASAQLGNGGFRLDGSMKIADDRVNLLLKEQRFIDTEQPPIYERIKGGLTTRFSISTINEKEFLHSVQLIKSLAEQGKEVLVYLPPFSYQSYRLFESTDLQHDFFRFSTVTIPEKLTALGLNFIEIESPENYDLDDTYFIDGFHPSEVFIALQLIRHSHFFKQRIDLPLLAKCLDEKFCNLLFDAKEMNFDSSPN